MTSRITDRDDWFDLWYEDKKSMLEIMAANMASDLNAGYDINGKSITKQKADIDAYKAKFDSEMDSFYTMDEKQVNRWCFYDMKKRGAIA